MPLWRPAAVCFAAFFLPACTEGAGGGNGDGTIPGEGEQTDTSVDFAAYAAFTASDDVLQLTDKTSVKDYIDALADDGKIDVEGYESTYGYYITSVNGISESTDESGTSGYSWMLYTDFTEEDGVTYADLRTARLNTAARRWQARLTACRSSPALKDILTLLSIRLGATLPDLSAFCKRGQTA